MKAKKFPSSMRTPLSSGAAVMLIRESGPSWTTYTTHGYCAQARNSEDEIEIARNSDGSGFFSFFHVYASRRAHQACAYVSTCVVSHVCKGKRVTLKLDPFFGDTCVGTYPALKSESRLDTMNDAKW